MRSLFTLSQRLSTPSPGDPDVVEQLAIDPEHDTVFTASVNPSSSSNSLALIDVHVQFGRGSSARTSPGAQIYKITSFETPRASQQRPDLYPNAANKRQRLPSQRQVVSLQYLADGGELSSYAPALVAICASGDIVFIPLLESVQELQSALLDGGAELQPEVVGTVEQGIVTAAWSPDDELVTIVTEATASGEDGLGAKSPKVILMTKTFDVLSEKPLFTTDFGEDQPVDVGWGSRATQFHGSAGKAAAAAAAAEAEAAAKADTKTDPRGPATLDDDGLFRVSWRGDGSFFIVSALEPFRRSNSDLAEASGLRYHRVLRIFSRDGNLSATSESTVRGLTHVLSVKPVGNIIASSQRFGSLEEAESGISSAFEDDADLLRLGKGRQGRHDIIFFERNGLRHGEFSLREEGETQPVGEGTSAKLSWTRDHTIKEIAWNSDGSALAVFLSRNDLDVIQIWTMGNYHWYLKQEIDATSTGLDSAHARISAFKWHMEAPHELFISWTAQGKLLLEHRTFFLDTITSSSTTPPHDAACVSVTDGAALLLTSLRLQNVPPPMCSHTLTLSSSTALDVLGGRNDVVPVHLTWTDFVSESSGSVSILAVLLPRSVVGLYALPWGQMPRAAPQGSRSFPNPVPIGTIELGSHLDRSAIQIAASARPSGRTTVALTFAVLKPSSTSAVLTVCNAEFELDGKRASGLSPSQRRDVSVDSANSQARFRLRALETSPNQTAKFALHAADGSLHIVDEEEGKLVALDAQLPVFCPYMSILSSEPLCVVGLSLSGQLHVVDGTATRLLARDATSFAIASSFLIWTNTVHQARFLTLPSLFSNQSDGTLDESVGYVNNNGTEVAAETLALGRTVERGSRIVAAVPSSMSLVLQMPRGNLETICPRPMVLEVVRAALDRRRYGMAFRICRTHRLDMNILHDHDPQSFLDHLPLFVEQIKDVDYLNLFATSLRDDDVTEALYRPINAADKRPRVTAKEGKVNSIATRLRELLQSLDQHTYINTILTTFAAMRPPAYESALELLGKLRQEDASLADAAVRYIIFLADADKLFDVALGTYDFALVLIVAQHAQRKDPREYLPFLRELRAVEPVEYQRFKIDEHLGRRPKALKWLLAAGPEHHEEAMDYVRKHKLHSEAVEALAQQPAKLAEVQRIYAEHLEERHKPAEAALAYLVSGDRRQALDCHRRAGKWDDALALAFEERLPTSEVKSLAREAADDYESKGKFSEAARIYLDYERDVEQATTLLCKAHDFSEAKRICAMAGRQDLVETTIKPEALEVQEKLIEELEEMGEQLTKQTSRLAELRAKKTENPAAFYMENDPALDNVDVMTDTSTQITQFTRYTSVPSLASMTTSSNMTSSTHRSKRNKRKEERKKNSGKKGSIYEEDYLFESLQKLLKDKLKNLQNEVSKLLPHLAVLSTAHRNAGRALHDALEKFEASARSAAEDLLVAEQEQERAKAAELDKLVSAGPEAWMTAYRQLNYGALARRGGGRARMEVASESWRCEALRVL
ncbi:putative elongator complex protein 1 [Tilletia horrida]|nr:putative elongator complex protein 1 [Tilletia horrida]